LSFSAPSSATGKWQPQPAKSAESVKDAVDAGPGKENVPAREAVTTQLRTMEHASPWHGPLLPPTAPPPDVTWQSDKKPRDGSAPGLTATEYCDTPEVLQEKVKWLGHLLRLSKLTVAYTGAGISVAAGIKQAAVGSSQTVKTAPVRVPEPTYTHHAMAALARRALLHEWVQQNHDGLPQKAGYPQDRMNEIHGSWFDPSNPVVKYSGSLRGDLFEHMENVADNADLALVLGTSLSGLNSDQVAGKTARRARHGALGTIIISPQRTALDSECTLRIFGCSDDVFRLLARELQLKVATAPAKWPAVKVVRVPYDAKGFLSDTVTTELNLTTGARVRLCANNNVKGSRQDVYAGIDETVDGSVSAVNDRVITVTFKGVPMRLGVWFIDAAKRGALPCLPVININSNPQPVK
jgi:NAD-dependent SIR2 family protein deacetylase